MSEIEMVQISGETTTLSELAGMDFSMVREKRTFSFPVGHFIFQIVDEPEPPKLKKLGDGPAVSFNCKCINVIALKEGSGLAPEDIVGAVHRETFFISTIEDIGFIKAFLSDIACPGAVGAFNPLPLLEKSVGLKFAAPIIHTPNRKDKDRPPYININREKGKIIPYVQKAA